MATENITISLPADIAKSVEGAVRAGEFASSDAVLLAALQEWQENREMDTLTLTAIQAHVQEGLHDIESGNVHSAESVFAELRQMISRHQ